MRETVGVADLRRSGAAPDARPAMPLPSIRLLAILALTLVASLAWRRGVYYEGGADAVVVAKGLLTMIAFALAATAPAPEDGWARLKATPAIWFGAYLALAAVSGAAMSGEIVPSLVLVARLALLAAVLVLVLRAYAWREVISALVIAMLAIGAVAVATGLPSLAEGRLEGGIPPLSPNSVSLLLSVPLIVIAWACLFGSVRWPLVLALPVLLGLIWFTGSRTSFAALLLAVLILALSAERISIPVFATAVLAVPSVLYLAGYTSLLSGFVERDDAQGITTLNSRTVAWHSAVDYADTLTEQLIGSGLTLKQIPVSAMYRDEQILDSTWVSALLQVGVLGVVLLALFVAAVFIAAFRCERARRSMLIALLVYLTIVSVLESGMFDASVAFIVFFIAALSAYASDSETSPP